MPTGGARAPAEEPTGVPTAPEDVDPQQVRRGRALRRTFLAALFVFLLLGATGVFGVRSRTVRAVDGGYELELTYGAVSRPGLATPWTVEVRRPGGFDGPVTIATTADYFGVFDENSIDPEPSRSTTMGDLLVWEFEQPAGEVLTVSLDARIEPGVQRGRSATTSVLDEGQPAVTVRYHTRVMP